MKTLMQSWRERRTELRAICKGNGERLGAELRDGFYRQHADTWWSEFCEAAERGDDLDPTVWRSARVEGRRRRMEGWVTRLTVRNEARREAGRVDAGAL